MEVYDRGLRLRNLRKARQITQKQAAEKLGVEKSSVSSYERNISSPSTEVLEHMAILYRSSADYILGLDHRKCIYIDDLTESQQKAVESVVEIMREEFQKKEVKIIER